MAERPCQEATPCATDSTWKPLEVRAKKNTLTIEEFRVNTQFCIGGMLYTSFDAARGEWSAVKKMCQQVGLPLLAMQHQQHDMIDYSIDFCSMSVRSEIKQVDYKSPS